MEKIEKTISNLIQTQFPAYYREEGQTFIQFVTEYYKWMESRTLSRDEYFCDKSSTISIQNANNVVVGTGTVFLDTYKTSDKIGICKDATDDTDTYEIYTVKEVSNNTYLTLTTDKLPNITTNKAKHGKVSLHANPLYYSRRFFNIKDIDETYDEFIVYFKEKYLKNIQFNTIPQIKKMVKNSLDLYRSKGTERSVDLLFKILYGVSAQIYYPARDIFRLSDGQWFQPTYLEVSIHDELNKFVGKTIKGINTGATAFVESVVRKKVQGKLIDVLYISSIRGTFATDEKINTADGLLNVDNCPVIVGSLTELLVDILGTGENFVKGDIVDVISPFGKDAKARVKDTIDTTGFINFTLIDGGYGYSSNFSEVLVAERMITLANVNIDANNTSTEYISLFDNMTQPYVILNFENANGVFANGDLIYTYYSNNLVKGSGKVLNAEYSNTTAGKITASLLSGNLNVTGVYNGVYKTSNSIGANLAVSNGYINLTATANVIGYTSESLLTVTNITGSFNTNEEIYQVNTSNNIIANGKFLEIKNAVLSNGIIRVGNNQGVFKKSTLVRGKTSNATANVQAIGLTIGVKNVTNVLTTYGGNYVTFGQSLSNAEIVSFSTGSNANAAISSLLNYPEQIFGYFDFLSDFKDIYLNAESWGFNANSAANLQSTQTINELLEFSSIDIGSITALVAINPGEGYTASPLVRIHDPITYNYKIPDTIKLNITNATSSFSKGEIVTQASSNGRGLVTFSNSDVIYVRGLRFYQNNYFQVSNTSNSTLLVGTNSGAKAKISLVENAEVYNYMGYNAVVNTYLRSAIGGISKIDVIDSGFGYIQDEVVTLQKENRTSGTALTNLLTHGTGSGYYKKTGGFLSENKKLFDAFYYQEYSYEVRSSVTLDKYAEMLKNVVHVAGTKMFASLIYSSINTVTPNAILDVEIG